MQTKNYDTRFDRFRRRENLSVDAWAAAASLSRQALNKYRAGKSPGRSVAARLVRSASKMKKRPVRASELWDVGEGDVPTAVVHRGHAIPNTVRKRYPTPLDRLLVDEQVFPTQLARAAGMTRQTLRTLRAGGEPKSLEIIAAIVRALRVITGKPIRASQLYDLGEERQ